MRKTFLSIVILITSISKSDACGWYDPDYEYFNLFTQEIISNKAYTPFLLVYTEAFYKTDFNKIPDENIELWQKYFQNKLNYEETKALVNLVDIKHLYNLQKGNTTHQLLKKLGEKPYKDFKDGVDYLIQAKYLQPYMIIKYAQPAHFSYYFRDSTSPDASTLNYNKTIAALTSLYNAAKNKDIKMRYGYQLVRFNHYNRNYQQAIDAFEKYVKPHNTKNAVYYMALDQMAGAQSGLEMQDEANWNFFQVFTHSNTRKKSAYVSMKFTNDKDFSSLLQKAKTKEEQNMTYFLLAYNDFTNPVEIIQKMMQNDVHSDILQVLTARAINQLERSYLPLYMSCNNDDCKNKNKRMPVFVQSNGLHWETKTTDYINDLESTIIQASKLSTEPFWEIANAYIKFLKKEHKASHAILSGIQTNDKELLAQINKMQMLNEIVAQPVIDNDFEKILYSKYRSYFSNEKENKEYNYGLYPTTSEFIKDILANRYILQNEHAKSFLMHNQLSELQYNPNLVLAEQLQAFYHKADKSNFEKIIAQNFDAVGDVDAFFHVLFGDRAMRMGEFAKAKKHYEKAKNFSGIPRKDYVYRDSFYNIYLKRYNENEYNGYNNISSLVFGHNVWESYESAPEVSMQAADLSIFPFIKSRMNKAELVEALLRLSSAGNEASAKGAYANQLIGNVLYNTSALGYFRELFVMDINNANSPKYHFGNTIDNFHYYYKNFYSSTFIEPDDFDISIFYYQKALKASKDKEQQARIIFQMASAEQGKFYQYFSNQKNSAFFGSEYLNNEDKNDWKNIKQDKFSKYFSLLKKEYADTKTVKDLRGSCTYLDYFM